MKINNRIVGAITFFVIIFYLTGYYHIFTGENYFSKYMSVNNPTSKRTNNFTKDIHLIDAPKSSVGKDNLIFRSSVDSKNMSVNNATSKRTNNFTKDVHLIDALKSRAGKDNTIFLSSVDSAMLPLAINLFESSYKKLRIHNYLFVCSDMKAHSDLQKRGIASVTHFQIKDGNTPSDHGTDAFRRKTHLKTKIVLDSLNVGLTTVIVDVDIVFFKNPLPLLDCKECDIQIQDDLNSWNSGFYMARPTKSAITLHKMAWESDLKKRLTNQWVLFSLIKKMQKEGTLKLKALSKKIFPPGGIYFLTKKRMFFTDNPPVEECIVHNTWIVSKAAKIYRFRELQLWWVDADGYYTDITRKYLNYENVLDLGSATVAAETEALKSAMAIAYILNRTLILPAFTCRDCNVKACKVASKKCSFNTHYSVSSFDSEFVNQYREHVFLHHPLVPEQVKKHSVTFQINTTRYFISLANVSRVQSRVPGNVSKGATVDEILLWFGMIKEPVLTFHSLYGAFGGFQDKRLKEFSHSLSKAIKMSNYIQKT